jgi:antitoxin (DNA-binding transcriptional repressor) of toxin-antitoxin stability system
MQRVEVCDLPRQLASVLDQIREGRQVVITDGGQPVAQLVPVLAKRPFPDLSPVRRASSGPAASLSQAVLEEREDCS